MPSSGDVRGIVKIFPGTLACPINRTLILQQPFADEEALSVLAATPEALEPSQLPERKIDALLPGRPLR